MKLPPRTLPITSLTARVIKEIQGKKDLHGDEDGDDSEGHVDERWLVSYADMMTLLFGFFVLLYSMSNKFDKVKEAFEKEFSPAGQSSVKPVDSSSSDKSASTTENRKEAALLSAELASANKKIEEQKQQLRLATRQPCRLCASWAPIRNEAEAELLGSEDEDRVVTTSVLPNSPAEAAGLRSRDVLLQLNNDEITRRTNIHDLFNKYQIGSTLNIKVLRNGTPHLLLAHLDSIGTEDQATVDKDRKGLEMKMFPHGILASNLTLGIRLKFYIPAWVEGIVLQQSADELGLKEGDVIQMIDEFTIQSLSGATESLNVSHHKSHLLLVWRKDTRASHFLMVR